jgi:cytochrome c oxidase subunit 4
MASLKLYTAIYAVLFVVATAQAAIEAAGLLEAAYWVAFAVIIVLSVVKAVLVAGYYQHLRFEPRSVTYLVMGSLVVVLALTAGAAYSIL